MKSLKERLTDLEGDIAKLIKELAKRPKPVNSYSKEEIDNIINSLPRPKDVDNYTRAEVDKIISSLPKPVAQKIDIALEIKKIITSEFISKLYRNK